MNDDSWLNVSSLETVPAPKLDADTVPAPLHLPVTRWLAESKDEQLGYAEYLDWCRDQNSKLFYGSDDL